MSKQISNEQLTNIVAFIALMENNGGLMGDATHAGKSPSYIIEKFNKYALQTKPAHTFGLDLPRQLLVKLWLKKWCKDQYCPGCGE